MKQSLIGSVVNTVTGTVSTTADALTGTTTTSSSTSNSDSNPATETPTTTSTPATTTTSAPASTTTSAPSSTTKTPSPTTSTPKATTSAPSPSTTASSPRTSTPSADSSSGSSGFESETTSSPSATTATSTPSPSSSSAAALSSTTASTTSSSNDDSGSESSWRGSSSGLTELRGIGNDASGSLVNITGPHSHGTDVATAAGSGLSSGSIVSLALGATGVLLLLVLLLNWCFRRKQRSKRFSSFTLRHVNLGATGDLPVFNTGGTERFATSSTSASFDPFHTAHQNSASASKVSSTLQSSGLWGDQVITAMRIPLEKLTTTALLSSGGYGEVYRGMYRDDVVALKVLLPDKQKDLDAINAFLAEIKLLATIDHPCIVRFLGVAWDSLSDLTAVLEFMEGGDLRSLLNRYEQEQQPHGFDLVKARVALSTAQAVTYLHSLDPKVLHRDLKSRNILLTSKLEAKVSDFGVSRKYSFSSMTANVGTSLWMAPEVLMGDRYDASADIFSLGVVLSELESQVLPYSDARTNRGVQRVPDAALLQLIAIGRVRICFSDAAPKQLVELGHACVSLNPSARPSASEVHYQLQLLMQQYELYTV